MPALAGCSALPNKRFSTRRNSGIALVITLLMLSVITFLAVAFLAMTRSNRAAVTTTLDQNTAKAASDAALNRAQAEIIARMMGQQDIFSYDYMASHNYITNGGFNVAETGFFDSNNVNYDYLSTGAPMNSAGRGNLSSAWVQNIANLMYDPRPPVFVQTNYSAGAPADFRFWVDLNRDGVFETNGYLYPQSNGIPIATVSGLPIYCNGEPEWIGGLQYPNLPHSATNRFLMRYAYLVAPVGKTLDLNYIHNYAGSAQTFRMGLPDHYVRDQGVGSWELNLGAYLREVNTNYYVNFASLGGAANLYNYGPASDLSYNTGWCFSDAYGLLSYRYNSNYAAGSVLAGYPQTTPAQLFGLSGPRFFANDDIDEYSTSPSFTTLYPTNDADLNFANSSARPWAGAGTTNKFYDPTQELFDSTKTLFAATNGRLPLLTWTANQTDTYDRNTFQRLLATMGTGSAPELETYVYDPNVTNYMPATFNALPLTFSLYAVGSNLYQNPPTVLHPKVNINYDNTVQINASRPAAGLPSVGPKPGVNNSPTNLVYWTQLGFFTNAADILLRSQEFVLTNQFVGGATLSNAYIHFGINAIPVYNSTNASVHYNAHIHRMLQLAANIYDAALARQNTPAATGGTNITPSGVFLPSVFRPIFQGTNVPGAHLLYIVGYTNDLQDERNLNSRLLGSPWKDPSDLTVQPNDNVWGVPPVVGAVKGLPGFNQYTYSTEVSLTRKLQFSLRQPQTPPQFTNQFYLLSISNVFGADLWNSYSRAFPDTLALVFSNCVTFVVTNSTNGSVSWGTNFVFTNYLKSLVQPNQLPGWPGGNSSAGFANVLVTNVLSMPVAYFSHTRNAFVTLSNTPPLFGQFLAADKTQNTLPTYPWVVSITNRVYCAVYDFPSGGGASRLVDFVNLGPFGSSLDILNSIEPTTSSGSGSSSTPPPVSGVANAAGNSVVDALCWNPAPSIIPGMSLGTYNQMQIAMGRISGPVSKADASNFVNNLTGTGTNQTLSFDCPLAPSVTLVQTYNMEAADPLVHYTVEDLTSPQTTVVLTKAPTGGSVPLYVTNGVTQRYKEAVTLATQPAPNNINSMTFVDPGMVLRGDLRSDFWNFPTNKFPGIGWLGRVHRGTPWQTVFLKADPNSGANAQTWLKQWIPRLENYPTNDYALVDLFTATPNDNAASGLLSINQTNQAAWSALLSGVVVFTSITNNGTVIAPADLPFLLDGNGSNGVNAARAAQRNGIFHHLGEILTAPTLTTQSPYVQTALLTGTATDDMVERIPNQVLGLLKVGQPQFVIYAWGQALRPQSLYLGGGVNNNLCTNYQITAEFLTRTVCHVVGDPFAANPVIEIDSKNSEP